MIDGGNATVFVADMDRAVDFYTNVLGLKLRMRAGDHWAEVEAPKDLVIGLHPASDKGPQPGTSGGVEIGLSVVGPIEDVVKTLVERGVRFASDDPVVADGPVKLAAFTDPDGTRLYLCEVNPATA